MRFLLSIHKTMVLNVNYRFVGERHALSSSERKLLTSYPVDSPLFNVEDDAYVFKKSTKLTDKPVHPRFVTDMSI